MQIPMQIQIMNHQYNFSGNYNVVNNYTRCATHAESSTAACGAVVENAGTYEHSTTPVPRPLRSPPGPIETIPTNPRRGDLWLGEEWVPVDIYQDTGSRFNWISLLLVEEYQLKRNKTKCHEHIDFQGNSFRSREHVTIHWKGDHTEGSDIFYVAKRGFPVDLIVGKEFLNTKGFNQFRERPDGVFPVVQKKPNVCTLNCVLLLPSLRFLFLFLPHPCGRADI
jgi:hypothetical protein